MAMAALEPLVRAVVAPPAAEVPGRIATVGLSRSCGGLVGDLVGSACDAIPPAAGRLESGRDARPITAGRRVITAHARQARSGRAGE